MLPWARFLLLGSLLLASAFPVAAATAPSEQHAFDAAAAKLRDGFYSQAEKGFTEFLQANTNSSLLPEALLGLAQAQILQTNIAPAIALLSSHLPAAGTNADLYQFWIAEAHFRAGGTQELLAASDGFAKLVNDFPASPKRLEALVRQATVRAQLADWAAVVNLLQQTNGLFQTVGRTNLGDKHILQGYLLLSQAQLAQQNYTAAERALEPLAKLWPTPTFAWEWNSLMGRIHVGQGRLEEALVNATNMVSVARDAGQATLLADGYGFEGGLLQRLGRTDQAIIAYTNNLLPTVPPAQQREALLKITEILLAQNKNAGAAEMLNTFVRQHPTAPAADLAWLTLGELQLRQFVVLRETNGLAPAPTTTETTNLLQAKGCFEAVVTNFPQSSMLGKAQLDLGWCLWLDKPPRLAEAETNFQAAVERLPFSPDQATARFKLADAQFQRNQFTNALRNYQALLDKFATVPEVRTNLLEPALYQTIRAALAAGDLGAATNALAKILAEFPSGFHTDRALLIAGQQIARQGQPILARQIFSDLIKTAPTATLVPETRLAIARTLEQEEKWPETIEQYESWLSTYTTDTNRPAALFYLGQAYSLARRETNAFPLLTNLIANFATSDFAPRAQWRVADYYYQEGDFKNAALNFQLVFQKWPASDLAYPARMMAGRVAVASQSWNDAILHFTSLTTNSACPRDLRTEAVFAYGDVLVLRDSTNKLADLQEAIKVFGILCQSSPTNAEGVLAWGRLASCYYQSAQAAHDPDSLTNSLLAFQKVIDSPYADVTARSIAKLGVGIIREAQALRQTASAEQTPWLELALNDYLDVLYGGILRTNEQPDLFWTQKAGFEAARLAEKLQKWPQAVNVYQCLQTNLPKSLSPSLQNKIRKAQEHVPTGGP